MGYRGSCNVLFVLALLVFMVYEDGVFQNPFSKNHHQKTGLRNDYGNSSKFLQSEEDPAICSDIHEHRGYNSECEYLRANPDCNSGGFLDYLTFFYCNCGDIKPLGYLLLGIWLLILFYLLGNTAGDYFCCCLEMLSNLLKLPPTVAGVSLLPLGNGAPDVFASIAAFVGSDSGDVGINSVLGGDVFITCIVAGAVSLFVAHRNIQIDRKCFIRDVGFFIIALASLLIIVVVGEVSVGGAIAFVSLYVVYGGCVAATELLNKYRSLDGARPLLPVAEDELELQCDRAVPYLGKLKKLWTSNVVIHPNESDDDEYLWGWNEEEEEEDHSWFSWSCLCSLVEIPLAIPRRLTIPIVEERRWSKAYAVASAFFSPIILAFLWTSAYGDNEDADRVAYIAGAAVGATLGLLALVLTRGNHPPHKFLFPWVLGGFLMCVVWFYVIANELVALLVALGAILGIKSSLLGLTVLAWGNSMGDLMSNVSIALNGGGGDGDGDGVQVAMSGCYAGPIFNTLVGLGISLLIAASSQKPTSYILPVDNTLYFTMAFLALSLIWSLIILPRNHMRPTKLLGAGLIIIYLGFLSFRLTIEMSNGFFT